MKSDEFLPQSEIVDLILGRGIKPILKEIAADLDEPLPCILTLCRGELIGPRVLIADGSGASKGEIRLRVRKTFRKTRLLFFAEAIFRNVAVKSGFSGFSVKGTVSIEKETQVSITGWTVRYNVWEWTGWI